MKKTLTIFVFLMAERRQYTKQSVIYKQQLHDISAHDTEESRKRKQSGLDLLKVVAVLPLPQHSLALSSRKILRSPKILRHHLFVNQRINPPGGELCKKGEKTKSLHLSDKKMVRLIASCTILVHDQMFVKIKLKPTN